MSTVRELAAETGLSIATISRVLNGHANVAPHTRDLVLRAAGRQPRAGSVHVHCPYPLDEYFGPMVSSIVDTLELHGLTTVLGGRPGRSGIDGGILILPPESAADLSRLRDQGFPFVVLDPRTPPPPDIAAVSAAHLTGARALMTHLVQHGHRRVGIIAGPREWLVTDARMAGYAAALAEVGVLPAPDLLRFIEPTVQLGYRAAAELLDHPARPTALACFNDKIAVGALRAARERGLRVPADLSIAGFDDAEISRATDPMLTTVRQPLAELGRMAVTLLLRMINLHDLDARHVELATDLIIRDSTGPA
ncbi:LacI family DNA-binding transcriptional regulator [Actinoplanes aureus]|uniref:LacI family DNA-binding transcriptional regulator n=1 Tax=Actinoplanes aureus TaxID=2792083 RepID=UPI002815732C|nr:LacI family DNA-binding transcriptional regulator [Actinoplanes aureus]